MQMDVDRICVQSHACLCSNIFFRQILERWSYVVLSACVVSSNVSSPFLFPHQELELLRGKQRQEAQELRSQQRSFFDEAVTVKWK